LLNFSAAKKKIFFEICKFFWGIFRKKLKRSQNANRYTPFSNYSLHPKMADKDKGKDEDKDRRL